MLDNVLSLMVNQIMQQKNLLKLFGGFYEFVVFRVITTFFNCEKLFHAIL